MSKISELAQTIEELRSAAAAIKNAAEWLAEQFSAEAPAQEEKPAPEPALTPEEVRAVLAEFSRVGHTAEVRSLLLKFGANKLSEVDPANYNALLREVEELKNAS